MTAATANRDARRSAGDLVYYKGHSGYHIYAGTLVMGTSAGYVSPFATGDTQAWFAGVAWDELDNTSTNSKLLSDVTEGGLKGRAYIRGVFTFAANGTPAQTDVGKTAYAVDDQTVGLSHGQAFGVGKIVDWTSNTYRVAIDTYFGRMKGASGWHLWEDQGTPTAP